MVKDIRFPVKRGSPQSSHTGKVLFGECYALTQRTDTTHTLIDYRYLRVTHSCNIWNQARQGILYLPNTMKITEYGESLFDQFRSCDRKSDGIID